MYIKFDDHIFMNKREYKESERATIYKNKMYIKINNCIYIYKV